MSGGLPPAGSRGRAPGRGGGQGGEAPLKLNVSEEYKTIFSLILIQLTVFYVNEKQLQYIKSFNLGFQVMFLNPLVLLFFSNSAMLQG